MNDKQDTPIKWIFLLSSSVILLSVMSVIFLMFFRPTPSIFQYRLAMALICFALSSIAGLLFAAKVEISGNMGLLGLTIGGTAALWLAALLLFSYIFPEKDLAPSYKLSFNLKFPQNNAVNPFDTEVTAIVTRQGTEPVSVNPSQIIRGAGGVVVNFENLHEDDTLYVRTKYHEKTWRSDDLVIPTAHLQMNEYQGGSQ